MRPRVHTEKHLVQRSLFAVASGVLNIHVIAIAPQTHVAATADNVREGSIISSVYIELWLTSDDAAAGSVVCTLEKRGGTTTAMTAANSAALDSYANKKNILHTQMGLIGPNVQVPMPIVKGWFKIPKGKQRFGQGDVLIFNILAQSNGVSGCGFSIYKEQY